MKARVKRIVIPNNYIRSVLADTVSGPVHVIRLVPVNQEPDDMKGKPGGNEILEDIRKIINTNTENKNINPETSKKNEEKSEITVTLSDILNGLMAKIATTNRVRVETLRIVGLYPNNKYYGHTTVSVLCTHIYSSIYGYAKCDDGSYLFKIRIDLMDQYNNAKTIEFIYDPTMWYAYDPIKTVSDMYGHEIDGWKKFLDHVNDRFYQEYFNTP